MDNSELKPTPHCSWRQEQRNITTDDILKTVKGGVAVNFGFGNTYVHFNSKNKVVVRGRNVITTNENTRNTRFDILRHSRVDLESLKYQVEIKNNDDAMCKLADLYLNGKFCEKNVEKARELYLQAANLGNSHAMSVLSVLYKDGTFGEPDEELSHEWTQRAADRGNVYSLGVTGQRFVQMYLHKESKGEDSGDLKDRALYYLEKAAAKGSTRAMWTLGYSHEKGFLGDRNIEKALEYYSKAAINGSPSSVNSLNELTKKGYFSSRKLDDILNNLVGRLAETSIGMLFDIGMKQINRQIGSNPCRGLKMVEIGALKHHTEAMVRLAKFYRDGIFCKKDLRLCQYWYNQLYSLYKKSADQGNIDSEWEIGMYLMKGYVGDIDLDKAECCFKKAITMSNKPELMIQLGLLYVNGCLGERDPRLGENMIREALLSMEKTAESNMHDCEYLGLFYLKQKLFCASQEKAKLWFSRAVYLGSKIAKLYLARMYLDKNSRFTDIATGLSIIEELILDDHLDSDQGFANISLSLTFKDPEYVTWLIKMVKLNLGVTLKYCDPLFLKSNANQYELKRHCLFKLISGFKSGALSSDNTSDILAYSEQLFTDFKDNIVMLDLCDFYVSHKQHNYSEYSDLIRKWVQNLPNYLYQIEDDEFFFKAASILGKLYKEGKIFTLNLNEAAKWKCLYQYRIIHPGCVLSINVLEKFGEDFIPIIQDLKESEFIANEIAKISKTYKTSCIPLYKILSRILGDIYFSGYAANRNLDKAIQWYSEASINNCARSTLCLATIFHFDGEKNNSYRALKYYKLAIEQGNRRAIRGLMILIKNNEMFKTHSSFLEKYKHTSYIPKTELSKITPFKKLDDYPRFADEFHTLGMKYLNSSNLNEALYWFRKSAKYSNFDSAVQLFKIYKSGMVGEKAVQVANSVMMSILDICKTIFSKIKKHGESKDNISDLKNILSSLKEIPDEAIFEKIVYDIERYFARRNANVEDLETLDGLISYCQNHIINKTPLKLENEPFNELLCS